jgi:RNAse (barnase) inhibitor barstar
MGKKSFILYNDYQNHFSLLSQSEKGDLLDCIFDYVNGKEKKPTGIVAMAFSFIKTQIDRDSEIYQNKKEKLRINGLKGGRPRIDYEEKAKGYFDNQKKQKVISETKKSLNVNVNDTDTVNVTDINLEKNKQKRFVKPSLEEIKSYCLERNNTVDAERFFDYYTSIDWKIGKNAMKDWKATIRTWEKNNTKKGNSNYQSSYNAEIPL